MEQPKKELYKKLNTDGIYTKSYEEFESQFSSTEKQSKLYDKLNSDGRYTKSKEEFTQRFFSEPIKKKVPSTSTTPNQKLVSGQKIGSSVTQKPDNSKKLDELFAKPVSKESDKNLEVSYNKVLKNKPLVNKPIKEVNREEISVPTKVDKQILAETPKQEITSLPQGFQEIADNNQYNKIKDWETKKIAKENELVKDWETKTGLSETEKQLLQDEVEEDANVEGIWNNIKQISKDTWNSYALTNPALMTGASELGINPLADRDPLADQKELYIKNQEAKGRKRNDIPKDEINENAKKLLYKEKEDNLRVVKFNEYLDSLPEEEQEIIKKNKSKERINRTEKDKRYLDILTLKENDLKSDTNKIESILKRFKNREQLSEEEILYAKNFEINFKEKSKDYENSFKNYSDNHEKLGTVEQEFDALNREYGYVANLKRFGLQSAKIVTGLATFATMANPTNPASQIAQLELAKIDDNIINHLNSDFRKSTKDWQGFGDFQNFATDLFTDNGANLLLMTATGGGSFLGVQGSKALALSTVGAYTTGNEFNAMTTSNVKGKTNYSLGQMYMASLGIGLANMAETATMQNLLKGRNVVSSALANGELRPLIQQTITNKFKELPKDVLKGISEEQFTNLMTNATKKYILKDSSVNLGDNFIKTMTDTATMETLIGVSPHLVVATMKPFIKQDYVSKLDINSKSIENIIKELENVNITEDSREILTKTLNAKINENSTILSSVVETIDGLTDAEKLKVFSLEQKASNARTKAESIQNDKSLSFEAKKMLLDELQTEYKTSEEERKKLTEQKIFYYNTNPERGNTTKPDKVPDGYTNIKEIENSKELAKWQKQNNTTDAKTEIPITETESKTEVQEQAVSEAKIEQPVVEQTTTDTNEPATEVSPVQSVSQKYTPYREYTDITKEEHENFVNYDVVSNDRLFYTAQKVKNQETLTPEENAIFTSKTTEINNIISNETKAEGDINVNGNVSIGDNADLQQREQQPEIIEVQSTANVGESKPNVKRIKSLKDAEYDVSFDESGQVIKINSVKDGREIPKFTERVNPKTGKTTLVKNANYARIEADSKGEQLDSRIKSDDKKVFEEAVLNFEPNTEYDVALNALANGAKVSMESLQKELGNTDQKWATNQSKSEQLPSIEKLSEQIWEESGGQLDQIEIRNQLIDIIQTNPNLDSLKSKLIEAHNSRENQKQEDELRVYLGSLSEKDLANYESIKAEDDYISELSDEEATQYYEQEYLKSIGQTKTKDNGKETANKVGETKTTSVQKRDGETKEQPTKKEIVAERKKAINANIDELANALKDLLPKAPNTDGLKQQGLSQDDLINFIAESAKVLAGTTIEISEAIKQVMEHLKSKGYDFDIKEEDVLIKIQGENKKESKEPKYTSSKTDNTKNPKDYKEGSFEYMVADLPEFGEKLSATSATANKLQEGLELGNVYYNGMQIVNNFAHSKAYIEKAVEQFGNNFANKVLEYIENNHFLSPNEVAIAYTALVNKLGEIKEESPKNIANLKMLDIVSKKRSAYLTSSAQAINSSKMLNIAKYGVDINSITNSMFNDEELLERKKAQEQINNISKEDIDNAVLEEESQDNKDEEELDFIIRENKSDIKIQKQQISKDIAKAKEVLRNKLIAINKKGLKSSFDLGLTEKLIAVTPEIVKLAKSYAKFTQLSTKEIVDNIYDDFKDLIDGLKRSDVVDAIKNSKNIQKESSKKPKVELTEEEVLQKKLDKRKEQLQNRLTDLQNDKKKDNTGKSTIWDEEISDLQNEIKALKNIQKESSKKPNYLAIVKQALVDSGFGKTITVTTKNGKKERNVLDWTKLLGEEESIDNIKANVEEVLLKQGYTQEQINDISVDLQNQYNDIYAGIIVKKQNELNRRNKKPKAVSRNHAYRLAQLYNLGVFDDVNNQYDNIFNSLLGSTKLDIETFNGIKDLGKALSKVKSMELGYFGKELEEPVIKQVNRILKKHKNKKAPLTFNIFNVVDNYFGLASRMILVSLPQTIANPTAGMTEIFRQGVLNVVTGSISSTKQMKTTYDKAFSVFKDLISHSGSAYGDVDSNLTAKNPIEDMLRDKTANPILHALSSLYFGKIHLDGFDSLTKVILTNGRFRRAFLMTATHESNPHKMTKEDTVKYFDEKMTSQAWKDAVSEATKIVETINEEKKVVNDNKSHIKRIAEGLVLRNLIDGETFTAETIEKIFGASYTSAGFSQGHEANNLVTKSINVTNQRLTKEFEDALKNEKWDLAIMKGTTRMFHNTFLKLFVGGGTNWTVLGTELVGLPLAMGQNYKYMKANPIDLNTEKGLDNLEEAMKRKLNFQASAVRTSIGILTSSALLFNYLLTDDDDDDRIANRVNKWINKNKWAKPYIKNVAPTNLFIAIAVENGINYETSKAISESMGIKDQNFEDSYKIQQAMKFYFNGKTNKGNVELVKLISAKGNVPIPWRQVKDMENLYLDMHGKPRRITPNYKSTDLKNAVFTGGFLEWAKIVETKAIKNKKAK